MTDEDHHKKQGVAILLMLASFSAIFAPELHVAANSKNWLIVVLFWTWLITSWIAAAIILAKWPIKD